jgi:hypothetical protein
LIQRGPVFVVTIVRHPFAQLGRAEASPAFDVCQGPL